MIQWAYVGGGTWELQGARCGLVGNVYGSKFNNQCRVVIEKVANRQPEVVYESEPLDCELEWARMLVEAHMERILRQDLEIMQYIMR